MSRIRFLLLLISFWSLGYAANLAILTPNGKQYSIWLDRHNNSVNVDWNQDLNGSVQIVSWRSFNKSMCKTLASNPNVTSEAVKRFLRDRSTVQIKISLDDFAPLSDGFEELVLARIAQFYQPVQGLKYLPKTRMEFVIKSKASLSEDSLFKKFGEGSSITLLDSALSNILEDGEVLVDIDEKDFACDLLNGKIQLTVSLSAILNSAQFDALLSPSQVSDISTGMTRGWVKLEGSTSAELVEKNKIQSALLLKSELNKRGLSQIPFESFYKLLSELISPLSGQPSDLKSSDLLRISQLLGSSQNQKRTFNKNIQLNNLGEL